MNTLLTGYASPVNSVVNRSSKYCPIRIPLETPPLSVTSLSSITAVLSSQRLHYRVRKRVRLWYHRAAATRSWSTGKPQRKTSACVVDVVQLDQDQGFVAARVGLGRARKLLGNPIRARRLAG